jgi:hypothetical protein
MHLVNMALKVGLRADRMDRWALISSPFSSSKVTSANVGSFSMDFSA